jgi:hypothetical protein
MGLFTGWNGRGLNHLEVLYQPGERALAVKFAEMLGCAVVETEQVNETGSTYMCVHPEPEDRDMVNNVLYLSEVRPAQRDLEAALNRQVASDAALASALAAYRVKARSRPHGIPHFGLRFPSFESIEPVLEALGHCDDPQMKDRISLHVVRPDNAQSMTADLIQAFVYTDIVATGLFPFGQLIELQAQRIAG